MGKFNYPACSSRIILETTPLKDFLKFDYSVFFLYSQYNIINTENIVI